MLRPFHLRSGLAAVGVLGVALALPAAAVATSVSFGANEITTAVTITDSTGVTDGLSVSGSTTTGVTVTSVGRPTGRPITASTGCTQTTSVIVTCPAAQLLIANLAAGSDSLTDHTNLSATLNGDQGNDRLFAGSGTGTQNGGPGDDVVVGGAGNDVERGGDGDDRMGALQAADAATKDPGKDTLEGGSGFDTINAADGIPDAKIDCGPPPFVEGLILDVTTVDLKDPATTSCDSVSQGAKDQHPLVQVSRRSGRVRGANVAVSLACPKAHPARRCAGTAKVVKNGRTLARGRYRIRKGRKRTLKLPLSRRARGRGEVRTRERDSHGKPETTRTPIRLRG